MLCSERVRCSSRLLGVTVASAVITYCTSPFPMVSPPSSQPVTGSILLLQGVLARWHNPSQSGCGKKRQRALCSWVKVRRWGCKVKCVEMPFQYFHDWDRTHDHASSVGVVKGLFLIMVTHISSFMMEWGANMTKYTADRTKNCHQKLKMPLSRIKSCFWSRKSHHQVCNETWF